MAIAMRGLNRVTLIGNLGKDPDIQTLEGGVAVAKFSLATTEHFRGADGSPHTSTEWHQVMLWRSLAELAAKYLAKGSMLYLEGKIKTRSFTDKAGEKRYVTEIIGDNLLLLDKPEGPPPMPIYTQ